MNFSKAHFLNELNKSKEAINESLNESVNTSEVNEAKSMPYAKARKLTKKLNDDKLLQNLLAITDKIHDKMGTNDEVNDWLYQIITYGNKHPQMWMDESVNLNEAAMIKLTVEPPYTLKQEKHFANKVKLIEKPITVDKVIGDITEDESNVDITLSNKDFISYYYTPSSGHKMYIQVHGEPGTPRQIQNDGIEFSGSDIQDEMEGRGSVVAGMVGLYWAWKQGKIAPSGGL